MYSNIIRAAHTFIRGINIKLFIIIIIIIYCRIYLFILYISIISIINEANTKFRIHYEDTRVLLYTITFKWRIAPVETMHTVLTHRLCLQSSREIVFRLRDLQWYLRVSYENKYFLLKYSIPPVACIYIYL